MNPAWPKFAIIVACTLSGAQDNFKPNYKLEKGLWDMWMTQWGLLNPNNLTHSEDFNPTHPITDSVCSLPCSTLGAHLLARHLLPPFCLALSSWLLSALPTLIFRGPGQVQGIRACLWPLLQLWLHLMLAYLFFPHNPVWAYTWALHAPASVLANWTPPRHSLHLQSLLPWMALSGVFSIALYAWNTGAPAGLIRWRTGAHSQCGWAGHLVAITCIDFLTAIMGPLQTLVLGSRSCA